MAAAQGQPSEAYGLVDVWESDPSAQPADALLEPRGLTVDPYDGRVLVVDSGNRRVQVYESNGTVVGSLGGPAADPEARLDEPVDVAVQGSSVFVTDEAAGEVALLSLDGAPHGRWSGLDGPYGIAAGADGRLFVIENGASQVAVFNTRGDRLDTWGGFGTGFGKLNRPRGAAASADGRLFVADTGNRRIVVFDESGSQVNETDDLGVAPLDIAIDATGGLRVAYEDGAIRRHDDLAGLPVVPAAMEVPGIAGIAASPGAGPFDTELYATFQDDDRPLHGVRHWAGSPPAVVGEWGTVPAPLGRIDEPYRVAAGDEVLVADAWRRIQRFDLDGNVLGQVPVGRANDMSPGPPNTDGSTVLVATDASLARLTADGLPLWQFDVPSSGADYAWLVAAAYDSVTRSAAALDLGGQRVRLLSEDGDDVGGWSFRPGGGASLALWDLAWSSRGAYVVNRGSDSVELREHGGGAVIAAWAVPGSPVRVAAGPDGNAYVLNRHGWLWKYDPSGTLLAVWRAGDVADPRSRMVDVAVDATGRVLAADAGLDHIEVYAPDPHGEPGAVPDFEPACEAVGDKWASPHEIALGEQVRITLRIDGRCPSLRPMNDVVLVIDHSGSMSVEGKMEAAQDAALAFLDAVDLGVDRVAVVGFNQDARLLRQLTGNRSSARAAIEALSAAGGTDIAAGVDEARSELSGPRRRPEATAVVVLLTDGGSAVIPAQRAAEQARLEGTRLFTIGFGSGANETLLRDMASAPDDYYFAPDGAQLLEIYRTIAERIAADVLFAILTVTDLLPPNMEYVLDSGVPQPSVSGQLLTWRLSDVPLSGYQLSYLVRPLETGTWPTNVVAVGEGTDGLGQRSRVDFPVPEVVVIAPTATPTRLVSPTPGPTNTPGPTATPTKPPRPIFMPLAYKERCEKRFQHADVAIVVDTSDSMLATTRAGRTKMEAAVDAGVAFAQLLDLDHDAAAIAHFNSTAAVDAPLTRDLDVLVRTLRGLPQSPGTRIDLGLAAAGEALSGPGRTEGNLPVAVVLTDGRPSGVTTDEVLRASDELKGRGVVVYVVGVGEDVDPQLLRSVASDPSSYLFAPDAEDLLAVYRRIARELPCLGP
ncbi:MAG: VWA domain-containing protein [Anaerolineae bacterium]